MPVMVWDYRLELGIQRFDEHHKHLVGLLNEVYEDFIGGESHETLESVLSELIDYATYHFAAEEYWMWRHNYPWLPQHHDEHERFSNRILEIQKDFHKGTRPLSLEVLQFLNNWISKHILKTDADYGRFAAGQSFDAH